MSLPLGAKVTYSLLNQSIALINFLGPDFHNFPQARDKPDGHKSVDYDDIDDDDDDGLSDEMTSSSSLPTNDASMKRNDAIDDYDAKAETVGQDSGTSLHH